MTWTKFGAEFRDECAEVALSDAAFRTHVEAIMYLYGIEQMDMHLQARLVRKWAGSDHYENAITELVAAGFWVKDGDGYDVVHHEDVFRQSLAFQVSKREKDKISKRKKRGSTLPVDGDVSTDVATDVVDDSATTQSVSQTDIQISNSEASEQASNDENNEVIDTATGEVFDPIFEIGQAKTREDLVDLWAALPAHRTAITRRADELGITMKAAPTNNKFLAALMDGQAGAA